jgi:hypothetical protein
MGSVHMLEVFLNVRQCPSVDIMLTMRYFVSDTTIPTRTPLSQNTTYELIS